MRVPVSWQVEDLLHHHPDEVDVRDQLLQRRGRQRRLQTDQLRVDGGKRHWHAQEVERLNLVK